MNFLSALVITWPQVFALLLLAGVGAFLAERLVGNAPKFGFLGSVVLALLGAWIFANLPVEVALEPRLEDVPVVRGILGGLVITAVFAYFRKQGVLR